MEIPNLRQIELLADGDEDFKLELLAVIKKEFPKEKEYYLQCIDKQDYISTAGIVHKLKHKISILGLDKGYETAVSYENSLRTNNISFRQEFEDVLLSIETFINKS